jgi:hypothetical protein
MTRITFIALFSLALLVTGVKLQPTTHFTAKAHHPAAAAAASTPDDEGSGGGSDPDTVEQGPNGDGNVEG